MDEGIIQHDVLERQIVEAQKGLQKKDPDHSLLSLVTVDGEGIHWTEEFGGRYEGMTAYNGLNTYISDLNHALKE